MSALYPDVHGAIYQYSRIPQTWAVTCERCGRLKLTTLDNSVKFERSLLEDGWKQIGNNWICKTCGG